MTGIKKRDATLLPTPIGTELEKWKLMAYDGLRDNRVAYIDARTGESYPLCDLGAIASQTEDDETRDIIGAYRRFRNQWS
jgi:hypothetical protein